MAHYKINFQDILLPNWESWDAGNYNLPAKNVTLVDGTAASLLVDQHGASIYYGTLNELAVEDDMSLRFENTSEVPEKFDELGHLLTKDDIQEAKIVFNKFLEREASFVSKI